MVTLKPEFWREATKAVEQVGGALIKIGVVTKEKQLLLKTDEKNVPIDARGWEHFKTD